MSNTAETKAWDQISQVDEDDHRAAEGQIKQVFRTSRLFLRSNRTHKRIK